MKKRSQDWVSLATAATDARDLLRRDVLPVLGQLAQRAEQPVQREALRQVAVVVARAVDKLRLALKRPSRRTPRAARPLAVARPEAGR